MTILRRRVLRPERVSTVTDQRKAARDARQRIQLDKHQAALKRWLRRLTRASNTVTSLLQKITRLETVIENCD